MLTINQHKFMIEKYQSVLFLSDNQLIIQTKDKKIEIMGEDIYINYYSSSEIRGMGKIMCVRFI